NRRMRMVAPMGWPSGARPETKDKLVQIEMRNTPAFVEEELMPPAIDLQYHVDFIYVDTAGTDSDPTRFWSGYDKNAYKSVQRFTDSSTKPLQKVLASIIAPGDSEEQKVRKLYAHTQQLRNTSFEREQDRKEADGDKLRLNFDVGMFVERGYGDQRD